MKKYSLGFAFDHDGNVALIEKQRPLWQKDRLNGIGGHIEDGETSYQAMVREFREETGMEVTNWSHYLTMEGRTWACDVFRSFYVDLTQLKTMTDEPVAAYNVTDLAVDYDVLDNVIWLVELALDPTPVVPTVVRYAS